jgi:integrase/recombinase XerD
MVMDEAEIEGYHASPKGLQHGFGVAAVQGQHSAQPRAVLLGHAQLATTTIDAEAVGKEERDIAARMWQ